MKSQWVYQYPPVDASYYISLNFPNNTSGAAGGTYFLDFRGKAAYTLNGGTNWIVSQVPDSSRVLIDISFINQTTGFCAGAYNTNYVFSNYDPEKYDRLLRLKYKSNDILESSYRGLFLKTTNTGQSWFTYGVLPSNVYYLLGLEFVNSTTGYAIASYDYSGGVNDGVIKTTNGGANWQILTLPENINNLGDICFTDQNTGFVCGYDVVNDTARGVILKTTNAGLNWTRNIFMSVSQFRGLDFSNSSNGVAVTGPSEPFFTALNSIYRTTNSGVNWFSVMNINNVDIRNVRFVKSSPVAIIYGNIYNEFNYVGFASKTTNFGANWASGTFNDSGLTILGACLIDVNNMYLTAGDFDPVVKPVILKTTNGAPIAVSNMYTEIPVNYSLKQNYPNPFNPVTNIEFAVPKAGYVKLSVFDISGREVKVLLNGNVTAGNYKADWDASDMPSGVYFCRISANDFTETIRMVLVK